jgi:signal transduction histidine kinase
MAEKLAYEELEKKVRKLNCLFDISDLVEKPGTSLSEILQGVVHLIPPSWQYPEITCARISLEGREFKTGNFADSIWRQTSDIIVSGEHIGALEVCYLEERPERDEGPFSAEERLLINVIVRKLGRIIELHRSQDALKKAHDELEKRVEERTIDLVKANEILNGKIEEQKRAEEALRETKARYKGIVEYTKNGVAVYRATSDQEDFIFIDFNRSGEKIEKIKRDEVIGKGVLEVFQGVKEFGLFEVFQRVWRTGKPEHFPVSQYKDQRIIGWRDNFVYKLPSGEIVAVYSDETERKQAEEALRKAHLELYNLNQELEKKVEERTRELREKTEQLVKAERLAAAGKMANRVAHELRNPLTVIGGFARRIYEKASDDDPNKKYLKIVLREVAVLENKVSEIIRIREEK